MTNPIQHALAKIIGDAIFGHVHPDETPYTWGQSMTAAQDVLAAIVVNAAKAQTPAPAPQVRGSDVPDEWKLVPIQPTPEMLKRGVERALRVSIGVEYRWPEYMADLYRDMIAFAPGPEADHDKA